MLEGSAGGEAKSARRPRILVINYACHPTLGSESAIGWGLVRTVTAFADCVVLTSPQNIDAIREWEAGPPDEALTFIEVPESKLAPWLNWHRIAWFMRYVLWVRNASAICARLIKDQSFDAVFHATISVYWLPTALADCGLPLIWGPVGGAVTSPLRLWPVMGLNGIFDELLDLVSVQISSWLPGTRKTWQAVTAGLINNEATWMRLPVYLRARSQIINHVLFIEPPQVNHRQRKAHILYFSPLETRKGPRLAIHSLCHASDDVRLRIVGNGPEIQSIKRLARKLKVAHRVDYLYHLPRIEALNQVAESAAVIFTGMREEGGASLAETMMLGTPVIVLANGGAKTVADCCVDSERVVLVEPLNLASTARSIGEAMTSFSRNPNPCTDSNLDRSKACQILESVFKNALSTACKA